MSSTSSSSLSRTLCRLVPIVLSAIVYRPLTRNYFHGDDFSNLYQIINDPFLAWVLRPAAGHLLMLRNALFYLFFHAFGTEPRYYFWIVLLTHLVNVWLLFEVITRLGGSPHLGSFGASLWGMAPVNEGALGWYSVYGQVVVASIVLVVVYRVARRMGDPASLPAWEALSWCGLLVLASVAFGVGIGIALVFPAAVFLAFPGRTSRFVRGLFASLPALVVVLWLAGHYAYGVFFSDRGVETTLSVLLAFLGNWRGDVLMFLHLLAVGITALLGGFAYPLSAYPSATAYAIVGAYGAALLATLITAPPITRRILAALLVLASGGYAVIAAGRASLWGGVQGIAVYGASEPRYHYVVPIFLSVSLCVMIAHLGSRLALRPGWRHGLLLAWVGFALGLYARSGWTIDHHADDRQATQRFLQVIGGSIRAAPPGQAVYLANRTFAPDIMPPPYFAGWASALSIFAPDDWFGRVYFVESNEKVWKMARPGSRLARLLAPPGAPGTPGSAPGAPTP